MICRIITNGTYCAHTSLAVHPGVWLKSEIVEAEGVAIGQLTNTFSVSRQALSTVLNGCSAFSADMAIRFEKLFDVKADTLSGMQAAFKAWKFLKAPKP